MMIASSIGGVFCNATFNRTSNLNLGLAGFNQMGIKA